MGLVNMRETEGINVHWSKYMEKVELELYL